jgi:endonuclease III-like uncharacterized protein
LGRLLSSNDNDNPAIKSNMKKAKEKWAEIRRVLGSEPILPKTHARFYCAIILNVLLYGSESWEISKQTLANLEAFNNNCVRCITKKRIHKLIVDGVEEWIRPAAGPLHASLNIKTIAEYISTRKTNLDSAYNATPIQERTGTVYIGHGVQLFA